MKHSRTKAAACARDCGSPIAAVCMAREAASGHMKQREMSRSLSWCLAAAAAAAAVGVAVVFVAPDVCCKCCRCCMAGPTPMCRHLSALAVSPPCNTSRKSLFDRAVECWRGVGGVLEGSNEVTHVREG